ncbi:MAG: TldD protein [Myxococcota bacterium]
MHLLALILAAAAADPDPLLVALDDELDRTMTAWDGADDAPYFLSYRVSDVESWRLSARYGAIASSSERRSRNLDVSARVGSYERDSTHPIRGESRLNLNLHVGQSLPIDASARAIQAAIWEATGKEITDAQESWLRVQTNQQVTVADEDPSPDFSQMPAIEDIAPRASLSVDLSAWEPALIALSARLDAPAEIHGSAVTLDAIAETQYILNSEGTRLRQPRQWLRISMSAWSKAEDGQTVRLYRWKDVHDPAALPDLETLTTWADEVAADTVALRTAEEGEPYTGPVLLRGKAAGVFIHEVIGHRVEGHRQKDENEGHTFRDKVGEQILPESLSIIDDPTVEILAGEHLNGYYTYDQEGSPAQPAVLVEDGIFQGFLMSRSPIAGFAASNGHGRAQTWRQPVSRMANTIVTTTEPKSEAQLRRMMANELRRQGREWGLIVDEIGGGFTMTGRVTPNAFNVRATYAWKVYADGRPDELIRGVDLVGTPLVALSSVLAAGDDPEVFNGFCGAESGSVPNSAVSPTLLIRQLEVQKKESGSARPPLRPKPTVGGDS